MRYSNQYFRSLSVSIISVMGSLGLGRELGLKAEIFGIGLESYGLGLDLGLKIVVLGLDAHVLVLTQCRNVAIARIYALSACDAG